MNSYISNQKGIAPVLLLLAGVGLITFLLVSNTFDFKSKLFSSAYQKPSSQAKSLNENQRTPPPMASSSAKIVTFNEVAAKEKDPQRKAAMYCGYYGVGCTAE